MVPVDVVRFRLVTVGPPLPCVNFALVAQSVANAGVKQHNPIPKMKILIRCLNMVNIQVGYNRDFLDG